MESKSEVWRVGIVLEASYLSQLKQSPMRLIKPISATHASNPPRAGVITLCKSGMLNTYQYANEYITPSPAGCVLHAVDQCSSHYPSMLAIPLVSEYVDLESLLEHLTLSFNDLHVVTGLPQSSKPIILLASQHFMESYGFFTREQVWLRSWSCPVPLEQVVLTSVACVFYTHADIDCVITQLYEKAEKECVIIHQGFNFAFLVKLGVQEVEIIISAIDCSPVLQGKLTKDTVVTFLPATSSSQGSHFSRSRRSTRDESCRLYADSAASAIEVCPGSVQKIGNHGYKVEAVSVPSYRLPSQYIVLPKETATKHLIFHCQNVWIESVDEEDRIVSCLSDVTHPLSTSRQDNQTGKRGHVAVAFLYEEECELERFVPPFLLGSSYATAALTVAYLHPEMLFFLFPETLSLSRRYYVNIKVRHYYGNTTVRHCYGNTKVGMRRLLLFIVCSELR